MKTWMIVVSMSLLLAVAIVGSADAQAPDGSLPPVDASNVDGDDGGFTCGPLRCGPNDLCVNVCDCSANCTFTAAVVTV